MIKTLLIESQCLPVISVVQEMWQYNSVSIEVCENYQKRSFRNKIILAGAQGRTPFSIPLMKGKHQQQPIQEVQISYDEDWPRSFHRLLQTNYGSAPYFHHYIDSLMNIINARNQYLLDLNLTLLSWVIQILELSINISMTTTYVSNIKNHVIEDRRNFYNVSWVSKLDNVPVYNQVYEDINGFLPNLSILDMIMCCGPESSTLLT